MAEENSTLNTFYESWEMYQNHLRDAIAPLSHEQLSSRPAPGLRSIGELVAHIVRARIHWFHDVLGEEAEEIAPLKSWNRSDTPGRTTAELKQGLEISWQFVARSLSKWNSADMQQRFTHEEKGRKYQATRAWVVWHIVEHDLHHGGEVSLTLGLHGLAGLDV